MPHAAIFHLLTSLTGTIASALEAAVETINAASEL
jgi:hypothetical protein